MPDTPKKAEAVKKVIVRKAGVPKAGPKFVATDPITVRAATMLRAATMACVPSTAPTLVRCFTLVSNNEARKFVVPKAVARKLDVLKVAVRLQNVLKREVPKAESRKRVRRAAMVGARKLAIGSLKPVRVKVVHARKPRVPRICVAMVIAKTVRAMAARKARSRASRAVAMKPR